MSNTEPPPEISLIKRFALFLAALCLLLSALYLTGNKGGPSEEKPTSIPNELPVDVVDVRGIPESGGGFVGEPQTPSDTRHSGDSAQGEALTAQIKRAQGEGGNDKLVPNALGLFPRINIDLEERVDVSLVYSDAQPGDLVVVQSEDGGVLNDNHTVIQSPLDDERRLRFAFKSSREGGIYRITLRRGFEEKRLEFWGGQAPALTSK